MDSEDDSNSIGSGLSSQSHSKASDDDLDEDDSVVFANKDSIIKDEDDDIDAPKRRGPRGGVVVPFPERLYTMLKQAEKEGFEDIVSWSPHGRCFIVHQPKQFVDEVMPRYVAGRTFVAFCWCLQLSNIFLELFIRLDFFDKAS